MGLNFKSVTQTDPSGPAGLFLDALSKCALADLVVDLLRQSGHGEDCDGLDLAAAAREAFEPIARVRGDRMPPMPRQFRVPQADGSFRYGWTLAATLPKGYRAEWVPGGAEVTP